MPVSELLHRSTRSNPVIDPPQALAILREHYGLDGTLRSLGSQQDVNFALDSAAGRYVLKICHGDYARVELLAQHAALAHLAAKGLPVPGVVSALSGEALLSLSVDQQPLMVRLLSYIDGEPLTRRPHVGAELIARLGEVCADTTQALSDFQHPGLERTLQWDPQHAQALIAQLLPVLEDPQRRDRVAQAADEARRGLAGLAEPLPQQAVHLDITDDNTVWARDAQRQWQYQGLIDFGDLSRTWRIADLAVCCSALLHHSDGDPFAILPAVAAYHARCPLTPAEAHALWPLVVARAAVLVLSSEQQLRATPDNHYIRNNIAHEWQIFDTATALPMPLMTAAVLHTVGHRLAEPGEQTYLPLLPELTPDSVVAVDLGVLSEHFEAGNWLQAGIDARLLTASAQLHGQACSRYGEYHLSRTRPDSAEEPETHALHVTLHGADGARVQAPFAGTLRLDADGVLHLQGGHMGVRLQGVVSDVPAGSEVVAGAALGVCQGPLRVQLCREAEVRPPLFVKPSHAAAWRMLCPSPQAVLGFPCEAPPQDDASRLLARRDASFARSQKHYYQAPPRIERGWHNHLIDMHGRSYLDMLNNVAVLGHGHPRMAKVAARQWSLLNTNSRFHYAAIAEFSERLLALAPEGMNRVFLVNSGTEANDLAIRLAWAASGGRDVLSVLEAYHGWSVATDAISTSIADNPQALSTRPDWVHPVTAPNTYRGEFRGPHSAADYVSSVETALQGIEAQGRQVAGFICEPVYGNAGGIALPHGYLQQVYAKVRARGGVCIADEVQVGYGRLGEYFWGFEEQGVVPDIITMAKGMGNGHPLGAVITTREIAEALEAEGYFFSSAGGSPVSCALGMAVLDVMHEEGLWHNAREVGGYFKARLQALIDLHPLVGAVHGSGFYLGVELVRDRQTLEPATEETARLCERLRALGIFMQSTGDYLNILKIKPPMVTTRQSVDFFVDSVSQVLSEDL